MPYKDRGARLARQRAARAANPEKSRAYSRSRAARRLGLLEFRHADVPSEALFDETWSAAKINTFLQKPDKIATWALTRTHDLRDEIVLFGIAAVLRILRRNSTAASSSALVLAREASKRDGVRRLRAYIDGSKQFSRIVEMLDAHQVDGKMLGDCTKGDLLRAAAAAEAVAGEATMHAEFYRLMAGMLPEHGVTVRQANNRKEIVALLTTTFKEPA